MACEKVKIYNLYYKKKTLCGSIVFHFGFDTIFENIYEAS